MRFVSRILFVLTIAIGPSSRGQDVITFKTGKDVDCKILMFNNGAFTVKLDSGETKQAPVANISSIVFGDSASATLGQDTMPNEGAILGDGKSVSVVIGANAPNVTALNTDIKLTVKKYDNKVSLENEYARAIRKKGLKAVAVNILVENRSANEIEIDWSSFKIKDQDDNVFDASIYATGPRGWLSRTLIKPGDKVAAWIAFEASPGIVMEKAMVRFDDVSKSIFSDWYPVSGGN
jgi:hypothetical protein